LNTSFYNGISGIKTQQFGLDTWGNNIANVDTVGFRYSDPQFATLMSQSYGGGTAAGGYSDVGLGATSQATAISSTQGTLQNTDNTFDLALAGKGFFGVQGPDGTVSYTRDGSFSVDANGYLVNADGYYLMGTMASGITVDKNLNGTVPANGTSITMSDPGKQGKLQIPTTMTHPGEPGVPAVTTTTSPIMYNLNQSSNSSTAVDPVNVSYFLTADTVPTMHIKDSSGKEVLTVNLSSELKGQHTYTWDGKVPTPVTDSSGNPVLDANGNQTTQMAFAPPGQYTVTVDYVSKVAVPPVPAGELSQYQVDSNGNVTAKFNNGLNSVVAKIPVYQFTNEQGLTKEGGNLYSESSNSGQAMFYKDTKGSYIAGSSIQSNTLESSNVSLADAMTELIVTQRAFDASSKCVTTSDQMIQKAIALKN